MLIACNAFSSPLEKQESWIIIDGSKIPFNEAWLKATNDVDRVGFLVNLKYDKPRGVFYHSGVNQIDLSVLVYSLQNAIEEDGLQRALIFNLDENDVAQFNHSIRNDGRLNHSSRSLNSELQELLEQDYLLLFSLQNHEQLSDNVLYFNDYFEQHHIGHTYREQILLPGKATASMLFGIFDDEANHHPEPVSKEERHIWQTRYLAHWKKTGMQPVFIVANEHLYNFNQTIGISLTTQFTNACTGSLTINGVPIKQTYWNTTPPSLSYSDFNFPFSDETTLEPYKPGYRFSPKKIDISENDPTSNITVTAEPINLNENLELRFNFNKKNKFPANFIVKDAERGKVLRLPERKKYFLGMPEKLNLVDHSFTFAFWFKHQKETPKSHILIGTDKRAFREGLHISLNHLEPYFGFFIDDLNSEKSLEEGKWHHLTFIFDKIAAEKRIYIDGKLEGLQLESHSFIGKDSLFMGRSLGSTSGSPSFIDNLLIWSRALSPVEVEQLLHEETFLKLNNRASNWMKTSLLALSLAIVVVLVCFNFLGKQPNKSTSIKQKTPVKKAFFLYGNFALFDSLGNNICNDLTPLSKELLLLLTVAMLDGRKGVSSQELTSIFWDDLSTPKARNSRNVAIARLRKSLEKMPDLSVEYKDGKHCLQISDDFYIDILQSEQLLNNWDTKNIECYFKTVQRGKFCDDVNYKWLETVQDKYNNQVISNLSNFIEDGNLDLSTPTKQQVCEHILKLDDLDEKALRELMRIYIQQGNRNKAVNLFNEFKSRYLSTYGEEFQATVNDVLR